eukprot:Em0009g1315a
MFTKNVLPKCPLQIVQHMQYNPAAALPPKLARRIVDLEFVEMSDLLPDSWQEETETLVVFDTQLNPRRLGRKAAIQDNIAMGRVLLKDGGSPLGKVPREGTRAMGLSGVRDNI